MIYDQKNCSGRAPSLDTYLNLYGKSLDLYRLTILGLNYARYYNVISMGNSFIHQLPEHRVNLRYIHAILIGVAIPLILTATFFAVPSSMTGINLATQSSDSSKMS